MGQLGNGAAPQAVLLGQHHDASALGRLVGKGCQLGSVASSCTLTPAAGMNSVACRSPRVMVPVLSSSSTSTSPAASTARPLMASTFFCTSRSMPAMPMALSSPPMVVGIRQTSSATRTVMENEMPGIKAEEFQGHDHDKEDDRERRKENGQGDFIGCFLPLAPSTRLIMRSRKLSPGLAVTTTLIWSDSTRVPPVTALRSPPASRMTGADSPVIADSSTVATPSMISPSAGMTSPADTSTYRFFAAARPTPVQCPSAAAVCHCFRAGLARAFAWAFPRPSAMASAKLANSTVNQSQSAICSESQRLVPFL